jgi:hypothetical protein
MFANMQMMNLNSPLSSDLDNQWAVVWFQKVTYLNIQGTGKDKGWGERKKKERGRERMRNELAYFKG